MGEHTPTPWELGKVQGSPMDWAENKIACIRMTVEKGNASDAWWELTPIGSEIIIAETGCGETSEENARFIQSACNSHDALLAACKAAFVLLHEEGWRGQTHFMLEKAIALAEIDAAKKENEK